MASVGHLWPLQLTYSRRGCAAFAGRDVSKLKGKGGGKFKYMSEKDMLEMAAKFAPYRYADHIPLAFMQRPYLIRCRSVFMWYMWRIENVDVAVLGG